MNSIRFEEKNGIQIIHPVGEMTFFFLEELDAHLKQNAQDNIFKYIYDLTEVKWIDSMGLGLIAMTVKIALLNNTRVAIVNPRENIMDLLRLSSLSDLVYVFKTLDDAQSFFKDGKPK